MFEIDKEFDKAMIYFIKNSTKQFLSKNQNISFRGFPLEMACVIEGDTRAKNLYEFFNNILMKENEECNGFILDVVPIILRINLSIVKF